MMFLNYNWYYIKYVLASDSTATVIIEAHQSSTNGSFVAGFGGDGDLDTFSLTNDGANQWWSATLDKPYAIVWVFVRIKSGKYTFKINHCAI